MRLWKKRDRLLVIIMKFMFVWMRQWRTTEKDGLIVNQSTRSWKGFDRNIGQFLKYSYAQSAQNREPKESPCEGIFMPLGCSADQSSEKSTPFRGRVCLRNDPQWFHGFLNYCSRMFPERLRNKSELVGSEKTRQALTEHPKYETPSYWILLRIF